MSDFNYTFPFHERRKLQKKEFMFSVCNLELKIKNDNAI